MQALLLQCLHYILVEVIHMLQTHGKTQRGISYIHSPALTAREGGEDGGGWMQGKRLVVEKVRGTVYHPEALQHPQSSLLVLKVDGEHCSCRLSKLPTGDFIEGIVRQPRIVHPLYLGHSLQALG